MIKQQTTRVGLIIPSSNRMVEQEMAGWYPVGVHVHVTRLRMTGPHHIEPAELLPRVNEAASTLDDARCSVIGFHCTANSTEGGLEGEQQILGALRGAAAGDVTTTATAVRGALTALDAKRIVLITPYSAAATAHEAEFLEAAGFKVVEQVAKDLDGGDAYCSAPPSYWFETAMATKRDDADVYFLSCANTSSIGIVRELEAALGKPVITSNQVMIWDSVRRTGTPYADGPGSLFAIA